MRLWTTCLRVGIALLCSLAAQRIAWADESSVLPSTVTSDAMTETQMRASLSMLDTMREALVKMRSNVPALMPDHAVDERGRPFIDDWQAYCLTESDQTEIQRQFAAVSTALDAKNLKSAANQGQALHHRIEVMTIQCKGIVDYWRDVVLHPPDWAPYFSMLRKNELEPHYSANMESLERTLRLEAHHGLFIAAMGGTWTQLDEVRARGQARDLKDLAVKTKTPDFQGLYSVTATTACAPAAARSSGKADPARDYDQPYPKLNYPAASRGNREHGVVRVGLLVSPSGCARRGFVLGSSGFERLDRAAVEYAMSLHLLPGEQDGVPIEALTVVPVVFELRSE